MSALPQTTPNYFTLEEYYGLLKSSERRWEYWDGEVFCMAGVGDRNHVRIQTNLIQAFVRLKGKCEAFGPDLAVKSELNKSGLVFPDMSVGCNAQIEKHKATGFEMLVNPIVLCEVVSKESGFRDYHLKMEAYKAIESLQDYIIIATGTGPHVTHYTRNGNHWAGYVYVDPLDTIELKSVGVTLTVAEIYKRVLFIVEE